MENTIALLKNEISTLRFVAASHHSSSKKKEAKVKISEYEKAIELLESSVGNPDTDTESGLHLADVSGSALMVISTNGMIHHPKSIDDYNRNYTPMKGDVIYETKELKRY